MVSIDFCQEGLGCEQLLDFVILDSVDASNFSSKIENIATLCHPHASMRALAISLCGQCYHGRSKVDVSGSVS